MNPMEEVHLTLDQVAARYTTSKRTIYRQIQDRSFPQPMQFGGRKKWALSVLLEFETNKKNGDSK